MPPWAAAVQRFLILKEKRSFWVLQNRFKWSLKVWESDSSDVSKNIKCFPHPSLLPLQDFLLRSKSSPSHIRRDSSSRWINTYLQVISAAAVRAGSRWLWCTAAACCRVRSASAVCCTDGRIIETGMMGKGALSCLRGNMWTGERQLTCRQHLACRQRKEEPRVRSGRSPCGRGVPCSADRNQKKALIVITKFFLQYLPASYY